VKGFLKEACRTALDAADTEQASRYKAARLTRYLYRRTIDSLVFVYPRRILLELPAKGVIEWCERPIAGQGRNRVVRASDTLRDAAGRAGCVESV